MGYIATNEFYVSKIHDSEATLNMENTAVYAHSSPEGFEQVIYDKKNYIWRQNQIFIAARLVRSQYLSQKPKIIAFFLWPKNEFSSFVVSFLTQNPNQHKTSIEIISYFNKLHGRNISTETGIALLNDLFKYLKRTQMFYFRHKSIPNFELTCCKTKLSVMGIDNKHK